MNYEAKIANIILRLKEYKEDHPEITLQKISDHTGVSLSTVTRIFDKDSETKTFRYDSIKPIAKMLLGLDSLDEGDDGEKALKAIIQYKETAYAELKAQFEAEREKYEKKLEKERAQSRTSIEFLKHQIELKDKRIDHLFDSLEDIKEQFKELQHHYMELTRMLIEGKEHGKSKI